MSAVTIHVAMASDERFAMHLNVATASLLANSDKGRGICVHVIHDGLSEETKARFESLSHIRPFETDWIKISHDDFKEFHIPRNLSVMTNVRLKLPELLKDLQKLIYLDCDIVVLADIGKLWDFNLGSKSAGGIRDYGIKTRKIERIGGKDRDYFNAGVMLLDLGRMRSTNAVQRCIEAMQSQFKPKNDQEIMNIVLRDDWLPLPLDWDVQAPVSACDSAKSGYDDIPAVKEAIAKPSIIHYTSHKPSSYLFDGIGGDEYFNYLAMTSYGSFKVSDRNLRNMIIRHSPKGLRTRVRHLLDRFRR